MFSSFFNQARLGTPAKTAKWPNRTHPRMPLACPVKHSSKKYTRAAPHPVRLKDEDGGARYAHMSAHTYVHTYRRTHVHTCTDVCTYARTYVRTCIQTYVRTYVRKYVRIRTYVRTYVRTCVRMYVRTYPLTGIQSCGFGSPMYVKPMVLIVIYNECMQNHWFYLLFSPNV